MLVPPDRVPFNRVQRFQPGREQPGDLAELFLFVTTIGSDGVVACLADDVPIDLRDRPCLLATCGPANPQILSDRGEITVREPLRHAQLTRWPARAQSSTILRIVTGQDHSGGFRATSVPAPMAMPTLGAGWGQGVVDTVADHGHAQATLL